MDCCREKMSSKYKAYFKNWFRVTLAAGFLKNAEFIILQFLTFIRH